MGTSGQNRSLEHHTRGIMLLIERYGHILFYSAFVLSDTLAFLSFVVLYFDLVSLVLLGVGLALILLLVFAWFITFLFGCFSFLAAEDKAVKQIDNRYRAPLQKTLGIPDEYYKVWRKKRAEMKHLVPVALKKFNVIFLSTSLIVNLLSMAYSLTTQYKAPPPFYIMYPPQLFSAIMVVLFLYLKMKNDKRIAG